MRVSGTRDDQIEPQEHARYTMDIMSNYLLFM